MLNKCLVGVGAAYIGIALATPATATITTFLDSIPSGIASFDQTVVAAGSIALTDNWSSQFQIPTMRGAYDLSFTVGRTGDTTLDTGAFPDLTGYITDMTPITNGSTPLAARVGSLEFKFFDKVNAFGIEIENWGLCCEPSGLYVSFDEGDPIRMALFDGTNETALTNGYREVFVGAIDDSVGFSKVQFWGDGIGEGFYAGGTIRYAFIDKTVVSPVPLPGAVFLLGPTVVGLGALRLRRRSL